MLLLLLGSNSHFHIIMIMNMISVLISCRRKVVEHICLLKAKKDLSEEAENDMLDYLYTTQYQMGGIIAISLGKVQL